MNKPTFVISCPIDTYSGYGARSRDVAKAVIELDKYEVKIIPQRWGDTPWDFIKTNKEWKFLEKYVFTPDPTIKYPQPDIWMQITIPNEFQKVGKFSIGVTAGIETTIAPADWVEGCNRMDLILGSSNHSINVLKHSTYTKNDPNTNQPAGSLALTKDIEVLFEGVNTEIYKPTKSTLDLSGVKSQFAFLFVGHWLQGDLGHDRKNVGLLIKLFCETFANKPTQPSLILKISQGGTSYMDRDAILKKIQHVKSIVKGKLPKIYLLHGEFTDEEMNELYNHPKVKAMVSLTKGEGFGRPLLEFTQTKKPILTTNFSGHIDFLKSNMSSLVSGTLGNVHPSAANNWTIKESQWFDANQEEVSKYLKIMFKKPNLFKEGARKQAYFCKTNYSFEMMKEKLGIILEEKAKASPQQMSLNLPKLKKVNNNTSQPQPLKLPKLKKIGETNTPPKIKLPKLKKVEA
tara:strand:- start:464 stop:1840 length:1377 start_codon:yes stop_codon:yes gene_type:complete